MTINEEEVANVADLASLELTEDERARMLHDLNSILDYVGRLNELDTSAIEPLAPVLRVHGVDPRKAGSEELVDASRADNLHGLRESLPHEEALANAPDSDGTFFKVPKVIER